MTNKINASAVPKNVSGNAVAIDSTGTKISYTAPAGKRATVTAWSVFHTDALAAFQPRFATNVQLDFFGVGVSGLRPDVRVELAGGESVGLVCTAAGAPTATGDLFISVLEEA